MNEHEECCCICERSLLLHEAAGTALADELARTSVPLDALHCCTSPFVPTAYVRGSLAMR
jgi:hypothetical protein